MCSKPDKSRDSFVWRTTVPRDKFPEVHLTKINPCQKQDSLLHYSQLRAQNSFSENSLRKNPDLQDLHSSSIIPESKDPGRRCDIRWEIIRSNLTQTFCTASPTGAETRMFGQTLGDKKLANTKTGDVSTLSQGIVGLL